MRDVTDHEKIKRIIRTELGLWFSVKSCPMLDGTDAEDLLPTIHRWRAGWDYR
jgi:hypothetical protein